jgi:hypothetical protein
MIINLLTLLPQIGVFILCVYYFSNKKSVDGLLLSIGSGIELLVSGFYRILPVMGSDLFQELNSSGVYTIASVIGFVSAICFVSGLGILITDAIKLKK